MFVWSLGPQGIHLINLSTFIYNSKYNYLSFSVGGAITHGLTPELEYQESLLKAKAIFEVLGN